MNTKITGIIVILTGALIMVGVLYVLFFSDYSLTGGVFERNKAAVVTGEPSADNSDYIPVKSEPRRIIAKKIPVQTGNGDSGAEDRQDYENRTEKDDLKRLAGSFAERFGSYSNQSNFSNIVDLKIFMSQQMKDWADSFIISNRRERSEDDIYYGITTRAIAENVLEYDDYLGEARVEVNTRRRESTGTSNNTSDSYEQDIMINFIKERGGWKVDSVSWLE